MDFLNVHTIIRFVRLFIPVNKIQDRKNLISKIRSVAGAANSVTAYSKVNGNRLVIVKAL